MRAVKRWSSLAPLAVLALSGCLVHVTGMVRDRGASIWLETPEGRDVRLVLGPDSAPIAFLDDLQIDVDGRRVVGAVAVSDWKVREGSHGLPTWVGVLERRGVRIGLLDRNSEAFYFVDASAEEALGPYVGAPVLLEGYVEGAHVVTVVYYRVLAEEPAGGR